MRAADSARFREAPFVDEDNVWLHPAISAGLVERWETRVRIPIQADTQAAVDEGLRRFEAGRFWDAHEAWEEAWLKEEGDVRLGLQGLIQMTAAFHKGLAMKNRRAALTLLAASLDKLVHLRAHAACFAGIDLGTLIADLRIIRDRLNHSAAPEQEDFAAPAIRRCTPLL